jgi:hypothetical protein
MKNQLLSRQGRTISFAIAGTAALAVGLLAPFAGPAEAKRATFSDPAFEQVWQRSDLPVEQRRVARSWTWGPEPTYSTYEPYMQGPAGRHLVTYLDKSRMEINNPSGDRGSRWYVTNGLLVVDMVSGRIQVGDSQFEPYFPANIPVAGDTNSPDAPTYASLARVASLQGDRRAPNRTGQRVQEGLGRAGNTSVLQNLPAEVRYAAYESTLGHNIPDVFWSFLNSRGLVYENGRYAEGLLMDWLFVMGYPISEPYWINIRVGGQSRWVLMQAFQRRILTYSPQNAEGWQVEMGNVGRAYFDWRYRGQAPTPAPVPPTATPRPAANGTVGISPQTGDTNTQITATGSRFPGNSVVSVRVEAPGYTREVARPTTREDGTFSVRFNLPPDASALGEVSIAAYSGSVAGRSAGTFKLVFNPSVSVSPSHQVPSGGAIRVTGTGFPARQEVRVGTFSGSTVDYKVSTRAADNGTIDVSFGIGAPAAGTTFAVVATANGGIKATSGRITVVAPPAPIISLNPDALTVGQYGTVTGRFWPANAPVQIGIARRGGAVEEWVVNTRADIHGNFTAGFNLGARWRNSGPLELKAVVNNASKLPRASVNFTALAGGRVVPSGLPMTVSVNAFGENGFTIKARGQGWGAGKRVNISLVTGGGVIVAPIDQAAVREDGTWEASFSPAAPWWGRRDLGIQAVTTDGAQQSVRYLPVTEVTRVDGGTYRVTGYNWAAGSRIAIVATVDGEPERVLVALDANADGAFSVNVDLPRLPGSNGNDLSVRSTDGTYTANFDF